jgi:hypothetical protein
VTDSGATLKTMRWWTTYGWPTVRSWDFVIGVAGGGLAFGVAISPAVRDNALTFLIAEAAIGVALTSTVFAGLALFATFFDRGYRRVLELTDGGLPGAVLPYLIVGFVSAATAIFATVAAIATPASSGTVQAALIGFATFLCCWAIAGVGSLMRITCDHARDRAELMRGAEQAEGLRLRRLREPAEHGEHTPS